MALLCVVKACS